MLRVCPAGQVCASSWFGQARSAQRDAAGEIPIRTLFLCCNLRGEKKPQIPTTLSAPADEALFSPPTPSPRLFQHLFEHFTTLPTRNAVGLLELGGLFSKSGRSYARKKHPGVLSKTGEGGLCRHPVQEGSRGCSGDAVSASPGRLWGISLHLPAGSAWHLGAICWEAAHATGAFVRGGLSWGPAASRKGKVMPPDFLMYYPDSGAE